MSEQEKSCATCVFSRWSLTPTGRIKKNDYGDCVAKFDEPQLPACICRPNYHRVHVWPQNGSNCPLYELNKGKPLAEGT